MRFVEEACASRPSDLELRELHDVVRGVGDRPRRRELEVEELAEEGDELREVDLVVAVGVHVLEHAAWRAKQCLHIRPSYLNY